MIVVPIAISAGMVKTFRDKNPCVEPTLRAAMNTGTILPSQVPVTMIGHQVQSVNVERPRTLMRT